MSVAPGVSIVLPVYNGARYLAQALDAVLAQTHADWELIAVDDASTDATPTLLADYARRDSRIRVIRNSPNRRLPGSLNVGFAAARGRFLTWTSDDNWHRPEALAVLVAHLTAHPDVDFVYSDYTLVDDAGQPQRRVEVSGPFALAFGNPVGASFLYRRAVHERVGPYAEDLFLAEDFDFWLRAAQHFRLQALPIDLYCYRVHAQSLTSQRTRDIALAHERALEKNLPQLAWLTAAGRAAACLELARRAADLGRREACRRWLGEAWTLQPQLPFRRLPTDPTRLFQSPYDDLHRPHEQADLQYLVAGKVGFWPLARLGFLGRHAPASDRP